MGRRSIPIQPIRDERNRAVTFVKRKAGLFKKAHELSVLCQVDISLVIVGSNGKIFEFSSNSVDEVMKRYSKSDIQESKTSKDFTTGGRTFHSRTNSTAIDSDDDDDAELPIKQEGAGAAVEQAYPKYSYYPGSQTQAQEQPHEQGVVHQQPQTEQAQQQQSSASAQFYDNVGRPKLALQIPVTSPDQKQKQQTHPQQVQNWTPQRLVPGQIAGQWQSNIPGNSPMGPYYPAMAEHQRAQQFAAAIPGEGHTPIQSALPSKYVSDVIQSPSNYFTSEWGVPWSANPNSQFVRPTARHIDASQGQPSGQLQSQQQQQQQLQSQLAQVQGQSQGGPTAQQLARQQTPGPPTGQVQAGSTQPLPQGYPGGLYSGGMPSAGVQTMFQTSPLQFTPNDAKRKSEDYTGPTSKKPQF